VGTSVRATDFFNSLPVRKQTALKAAPKTLAKIKHILQAYALARPTIRFSLKVLKAKTDKGNFLYAPKAGASSVKDAASKIFGNNCTSQCSWHVLQSHSLELQAFCPTPEAATAKISNIGQFLSVDSRPMATSRGTMKQIVSLFKEKLRQSIGSLDSVKNPSLCLNIVCPKASYDPNVEPSKDDVLFDDSNKVIAAVTELFTAIYPIRQKEQSVETIEVTGPEIESVTEAETAHPERSQQQQPSTEKSKYPAMPPATTVNEDYWEDVVLNDEELSFLEQRARASAWRPNMYGYDEEDPELSANINDRPASQEIEDPKEAARELNPWTIAKMNAPVRRNDTNNEPGPTNPVQQSLRERVGSIFSAPPTQVHQDRRHPYVTPANSWTAINQHQVNVQSALPTTTAQYSQLPVFGLPTPQPSSSPAFGTPLDAILPDWTSKVRQTRSKANINKPFVQPLGHSNWDFGPPSWPKKKSKPQGNHRNKDIRDAFCGTVFRNPPQEPLLVMQGEPLEEQNPSDDAMLHEFNTRLKESEPANTPLQTRRSIETDVQPRPAASLTRMRSKPRPDESALEPISANEAHAPPAKRRRTTEGAKRSKSSCLPLERVQEHQQMHQTILQTKISLKDITTDLSRLNGFDIMSNGVPWDFDAENVYHTFEDGVDPGMVRIWSQKVKGMLEKELERLEEIDDKEKALVCVGALSRLERVEKEVEV
jgi:hypothetical protein